MKIGILGGTFDPIHLGHLTLARKAQTQFSLEKILFIPTWQSPHKQSQSPLSSVQDRYEMVKLAVKGEPCFEACDLEIKRQGISYTADTLEELQREYPAASFFFILGQDSFESLDSWKRADWIKKEITFLVAKRQAGGISLPAGARFNSVSMPLCSISASAIRDKIRQRVDVKKSLPPKVFQYIQTHRLYQEQDR